MVPALSKKALHWYGVLPWSLHSADTMVHWELILALLSLLIQYQLVTSPWC